MIVVRGNGSNIGFYFIVINLSSGVFRENGLNRGVKFEELTELLLC